MLLAFLHLSPSDGASGRSRHTFDPRSQVKTDTKGSVHYEAWRQPHDETTRMSNEPDDEPLDVLTKPKILPIEIKWERMERDVRVQNAESRRECRDGENGEN